MQDSSLTRAEFLSNVGKVTVGICACAMTSGIYSALAEEIPLDSTKPKPETPPLPAKNRADERIKFAEGWVTRFFHELDTIVPEETRKKLMMANGCSCHRAWIASEGIQIQKYKFDDWAAWVKKHPNEGVQVDGNVIHYKYMSAAETGQASADSACLCPFVETKPSGLSATYCYCSVGYVKEMHEKMFDRPVEVELVESVLQGAKRCHFKITVPQA
jgi:hypothetical protein